MAKKLKIDIKNAVFARNRIVTDRNKMPVSSLKMAFFRNTFCYDFVTRFVTKNRPKNIRIGVFVTICYDSVTAKNCFFGLKKQFFTQNLIKKWVKS